MSGPLSFLWSTLIDFSECARLYCRLSLIGAIGRYCDVGGQSRGTGCGTGHRLVYRLYLAEVAPKHIRGGLIALYQLMITIGILLSFIIDTLLAHTANWRLMLGSVTIPAVLMFLAGIFLLRSPRWLMLRGSRKAAELRYNVCAMNTKSSLEADDIEQSLKVSHTTA